MIRFVARNVLIICLAVTASCGSGRDGSRPVPDTLPGDRFFYLTDLGNLGQMGTHVQALNDSGVAVGYSVTASGAVHAFSWRSGKMTDLGTLGGSQSRAFAINSGSQIVGFSTLPGDTVTHACLWSGGKIQDLGSLGGDSAANAIDDSGQIAGTSANAQGVNHAFLYSGGTMRDLGPSASVASSANAIVGPNEVAGASTFGGHSHAALWSNGTWGDLGTLGGATSTVAAANASGLLVGTSDTNTARVRDGFSYQGSMTALPTLGGLVTNPNAVSPQGWIVGFCYTADDVHACLWSGGQIYDVSTMLNVSGWDLETATGINRYGDIVANGFAPDGTFRGVLLNPS
jgi:probable HAF family extracellular repeat protein